MIVTVRNVLGIIPCAFDYYPRIEGLKVIKEFEDGYKVWEIELTSLEHLFSFLEGNDSLMIVKSKTEGYDYDLLFNVD